MQSIRSTPVRPGDAERQTLSIREAGAILGVCDTIAYRMARSGQLPTVPVGKRKVVPKISLQKMLDVPVPGRTE